MKNESMRTGRFTAMLAALACSAWGAGVACAQLVLPDPIPVGGVQLAMGDIDGDGLFDVVVSHRTQNVVKVWQAVDDDNFVLAESWEVADAAAVVLADFDGDGELDLAFGSSADDSVTMAYGFGDFTFAVDTDNPIMVGVSPGVLGAMDRCDGELPDLLVSNAALTTIMFVQSPTLNPVVTLVTLSFEFPNCPGGMSEGPCHNYTEPDCEPNSQGEGIQECARAAACRMLKCEWNACMEYEEGGGGFGRGFVFAGKVGACFAMNVAEIVACVPKEVIPRW